MPREVPNLAPRIHNAPPQGQAAQKDCLHLWQVVAVDVEVQLSRRVKGSKDIKIPLARSHLGQAGKFSGPSCALMYTLVYNKTQTHPGKWHQSLETQIPLTFSAKRKGA